MFTKKRSSLLLAGTFSLLFCSGCGESAATARKEPPSLSVSNPLRKDTVLSKEYVCQISAIRHIELRALTRGYLENVHIDEGQAVKQGQLMFQIMPRFYQAKLNKAQAEAQFAEVEYQNTAKLAQTNVVAASELALAKAKLDKAKASLALSQAAVDFTQVKAPFDGIIGRFYARQGSLLEGNELLTTLADTHEMWVYFNVPESEYLSHKRRGIQNSQMPVKLMMADGSVYNHEGVVTAVEADFDNHTGTIAYRASFPNPDGLLRHGQTGKVIFDESLKNALIIPQSAVMEILDKRFVLTVDATGKVSSKEIRVGAQIPDLFVVTDGLSESDQILLEGQRKVNEGDTINPKFQDPSQVIASLKAYAE